MSNSNIDHLFKENLKDGSCEPPPHIWDNIREALDRRKKRKAIVWWSSVAAIFVLLLSTTWLMQLKKEMTGKEIQLSRYNHVTTPVSHADSMTVSAKTNDTRIVQVVAVSTPVPVTSKADSEKEKLIPAILNRNNKNVEVATTPPHYTLSNGGIRSVFIPLTSKAAIENHILYQKLLDEQEIKEENKETDKNKVKISLSGHIVPVYSSGNFHSPAKNSKTSGFSKEQMSGIVNVGGGIKLSVAATRRLSLQTGLFYTRMGQKTDGNNVYIPRSASFLSTNESNYVATPLGNIKNKANAIVYRTESPMALSRNNSADNSIEQLFSALEIPFALKYTLNDNKIKFSVIGGFSGSFMIDNQAYLKYEGQRESMGKTEDIRNFNISTDFGLNIEYPITSKIKIMVEPGGKYYLRSISQNRNVDFKPYQFSFSTGVGIDF